MKKQYMTNMQINNIKKIHHTIESMVYISSFNSATQKKGACGPDELRPIVILLELDRSNFHLKKHKLASITWV